jgi:hypothetical protein
MRRWILAALVLALAVGAAAAYAYGSDDRYEAVARVVVHPIPAGDDTLAGIDVLRDSQDGARLLETAQAYFETPDVTAAAADRVDVDVATVRDDVEVHPLRGSNVLEIVGTSTDPRRAAQLANAVVQEGIAQRTGRFQAQVAAVLAKLRGLGSVEARRRIVDLRTMQSRPDPTLEPLSSASAPTAPSWPEPEVVLPAGAGIGLGLAALIVLLPPLLRVSDAQLQAPAVDEEARRELEDREQALERRAAAIEQRGRELAAVVEEARVATGERVSDSQSQAEERLKERINAVTQREQATARRAAEVTQKERELDQSTRALSGREDQVEARERALAEREHVLAEREEVLADRENALAEREGSLVDREDALAEREAVPAVPERAPPIGIRPGTWTIQDLERLVAQHGDAYPDRVEEWRYYVHFLRDHADVDGNLPATFDYLVDETFGDLLAR